VLKERLPKEVRLNGTCSSGVDDDRNDCVLLRVVMCRLSTEIFRHRYLTCLVGQDGQFVGDALLH